MTTTCLVLYNLINLDVEHTTKIDQLHFISKNRTLEAAVPTIHTKKNYDRNQNSRLDSGLSEQL